MSGLSGSVQSWIPLAGGAGTFIFLLTIIRGFQRDFIQTQSRRLVELDAEMDEMRIRLTTMQVELDTLHSGLRLWKDAAFILWRTVTDTSIVPSWVVNLMQDRS